MRHFTLDRDAGQTNLDGALSSVTNSLVFGDLMTLDIDCNADVWGAGCFVVFKEGYGVIPLGVSPSKVFSGGS